MSTWKKLVLLAGDLAALYAALVLALLVRYGFSAFPQSWQSHLVPFSALFILWLFVFYLADLYRHRRAPNRAALLSTLTATVVVAALLSTVALYLFGDFFRLTPKTNLLIFSVLFLGLDFFIRSLFLRLFASGALGVAFLGTSPLAEETAHFLKENPTAGYRIELRISDPHPEDFRILRTAIENRRVHLVVVQPHFASNLDVLSAVYRLLPLEVGILNFWDFYELVFEKIPLDELAEAWFLENITTRRPFYDALKRLVDIAISTLTTVIFSPFMLLSAILIALSSRGPVIFRQERVGKNGIPFTLFKFRTMRENHGPLWTEAHDPRLTPVGRVLRFTHLDEFPQLLNVFRGDLSLTGPRAERVELVRQYERLPYYGMRHMVKPGLTGWAQINYKPSASPEEAYEKLRYDIYYIKNRSLVLDLLIILKTVRYLFASHG